MNCTVCHPSTTWQYNVTYTLYLHFIPEASHFSLKVLLAARLHGFLLHLQKLHLSEAGGGEDADMKFLRCYTQ